MGYISGDMEPVKDWRGKINHREFRGQLLMCIIDFIQKHGIDLKVIGMKEFAFKKDNALDLLDMIKSYLILIFGGDILRKNKNKFEYTYSNWSYEKENILESIKVAEDYINQYLKGTEYVVLIMSTNFYKEILILENKT